MGTLLYRKDSSCVHNVNKKPNTSTTKLFVSVEKMCFFSDEINLPTYPMGGVGGVNIFLNLYGYMRLVSPFFFKPVF